MIAATIVANVSTRDSQRRITGDSGSQRLAKMTRDFTRDAAKLVSTIDRMGDRIARDSATVRGLRVLLMPTPEQRAARDRAAFDAEMAARAERQRQQNRDAQDRADEFYGRTGR